MKVLLSAYSCEPGKGSEQAVGWNWALQIARWHEVWVITRANNQEPIEKALSAKTLDNLHWVYFDLPRWARFWKRGDSGLYLYYYLWQLCIYFVGRRVSRKVKFDIVHHVTFGNFWSPSFLSLLSVPFIWGPVGAGLPAPKAFWTEFSFRGKVNEGIRAFALLMARLDPVRAMTEDRARMILAVSSGTAKAFTRRSQRKISLFSGVGFDSSEFDELEAAESTSSATFTVLSVGRLVHWKGFALAIKAFAIFHKSHPNSRHWIVGSGPEKATLVELANSLGVSEHVHFLGAVSREDYLGLVRCCDLFLYPSLHEPGAFVIIEAMATRKPVVCLDLGEPALLVNEETGIRVPALSPSQVASDLAEAMASLFRDPALRERMGQAGRQRVQKHFRWEEKGADMAAFYEKALGGG
jgi:glycosyltransferase involved in cell wall biosynthesis